MKFLIMTLLCSQVFAARGIYVKDNIKSFEAKKDVYYVKFKNMPQVFEVSKSSPVIPCLENAWKSNMDVSLVIDEHHGYIDSCKLSSNQPLQKIVK